jgi:formylglycine-generating enzyme required for sulfatase activity
MPGRKVPCDLDHCPTIEWSSVKRGYYQVGELNGQRYNVSLSAFDFMKTELTVGQYRPCVEANVCDTNGMSESFCTWSDQIMDNENRPLNCLSYLQLDTFAQWLSTQSTDQVRIMSESEWEYVARSEGLLRRHPWGEAPNNQNYCDYFPTNACMDNPPAPVCSHQQAVSNQGGCDLVGNLAEWTSDEWSDNPTWPEDGRPLCVNRGCIGDTGVIRGGSYGENVDQTHSLSRQSAQYDQHSPYIGGRLMRHHPSSINSNPQEDTKWIFVDGGVYDSPFGAIDGSTRVQIDDLKVMKHEITVGQYQACVQADHCDPVTNNFPNNPGLREEHPITGVTPVQIREYAAWLGDGARLPTQIEWAYVMQERGIINPDLEFNCSLYNLNSCMGNGMTMGVCLLDDLNQEDVFCDAIGNAAEMIELTHFNGIGIIGGGFYTTFSDNLNTSGLIANETLLVNQSLPYVGARLVKTISR